MQPSGVALVVYAGGDPSCKGAVFQLEKVRMQAKGIVHATDEAALACVVLFDHVFLQNKLPCINLISSYYLCTKNSPNAFGPPWQATAAQTESGMIFSK